MLKNARSIDSLDDAVISSVSAFKDAKKYVPILIVDDRQAKAIQDLGYKNVTTKQDLPSEEFFGAYQILLLDVNGVGLRRDSNGLDFALNYKHDHPLTQIIMVSAFLKGASSEKYRRADLELNGLFNKGESYDINMRSYLDDSLRRVLSPKVVWKTTRSVLLNSGMSLGCIAYYEDEFVRSVENVYVRSKKKLPFDWLDVIWTELDDEVSKDLTEIGACRISDPRPSARMQEKYA